MRCVKWVAAAAVGVAVCGSAGAIDEAHRRRGEEMAARAIGWLLKQQDEASGGWSVVDKAKSPGASDLPAITGLVLNGLLMDPAFDADHPAVAKGVAFVLRHRKADGGIYDRILPSYNTSVCLSALARVNRPEAAAAIRPAQDFLRAMQWSEVAGSAPAGPGEAVRRMILGEQTPEKPERVGREHPFYGGLGYGRNSRPDLSNTQFALQALHDSGLSVEDEAFRRAMVFLSRVQMLERAPDGTVVNEMEYAKGSRQGGFIYSTSRAGNEVGVGQTMAPEESATIEETLDDGTRVSRLRAYGSMTYAGFKSLIYAGLSRDDPRVEAAVGWARRNYTLEENPGVGLDGLYYYFVMFARAMDARGEATIRTVEVGPDGVEREGEERDWANDLVDRLGELQEADGSFRSVDGRWMEDNAVLITAYALLALEHAVR